MCKPHTAWGGFPRQNREADQGENRKYSFTRIYSHVIFLIVNINLFGALAEPNRLRIIELLRDNPACTVGEIARRLDIRQPQVSKHLRVLKEAGLVGLRPQAQQRLCELETKAFEELETWTGSFWGRRERNIQPFQAGGEHRPANTDLEED